MYKMYVWSYIEKIKYEFRSIIPVQKKSDTIKYKFITNRYLHLHVCPQCDGIYKQVNIDAANGNF